MKITDLALVFIGIILPIIIVVYINVSFTIKAQEQEMYYQNIIDIAAQDAANQMKEVENDDSNVDYGYSGVDNQKISVNAQIAVDTFLNNLYNNFNIKGNEAAQKYLQLFVPAIAIIDYDGVQISSVESSKDMTDTEVQSGKINTYNSDWSVTKHVLKPKRYYTYTYSIIREGGASGIEYKMVDGISSNPNAVSYHEIEFTMDDYLTHRQYEKNDTKESQPESFYLTDGKYNDSLVSGIRASEASNAASFKQEVIQKLSSKREDTIANTLIKEMTYATNANNSYARSAGITYNFSFPTTTHEELYGTIKNVGFMAFVQGLSVGTKYLNTKAYGLNNLGLATRYYFTIPNIDSKYKLNLYHKDTTCPEYVVSKVDDISPRYAITKQQAASMKVGCTINDIELTFQGFYPCPICSP